MLSNFVTENNIIKEAREKIHCHDCFYCCNLINVKKYDIKMGTELGHFFFSSFSSMVFCDA